MKKENELIKVFSGSEIVTNLLKSELEEAGIPSLLKNDFAGLAAGYITNVPTSVALYINESDMEAAEPLISEYIKNNPQ